MRHHTKTLTPLAGTIMAAAALCGLAFAQSGLTTIQDTLFKADGTHFSGSLTIQWSTFDAANIGTIVQQSRTVTVVNGNLLLQLAPNAGIAAPANVYTVTYQSDGSQQFTEAWTVPVSAAPLTVAEVRTAAMTSSGTGGSAGNSTSIPESAVIGLVSDLGQRPTKGPGFGVGAVADINQNGQIETVVGNVGDCVYVDGTAGACGGQVSQFFDAEIPGGIVDGVNGSFTLVNPPSGSSLALFRNGLYMLAGQDYTLSGSTLQFMTAYPPPQPGDTLVANYRIDPSSGDVGGVVGAVQGGASSSGGNSVAMAQVLCSGNGRTTALAAWTSLGTCDIPAASLNPGDRIEVRFNFAHGGSASAFDIQVNWGSTTIVARHGSMQDAAVAGEAEASLGVTGAQVTTESWGTVLSFLPSIVTSAVQSGVQVNILGEISNAGSDSLSLAGYTVLRYPRH